MTSIHAAKRLAPLGALAIAIVMTGCSGDYPYYRASDGTVTSDLEPTLAFRATASRDIPCAPEQVHVFQLHSWSGNVPGSTERILPFAANALEIADGCGQRVVYKEECGAISAMLPREIADQAAASGASRTGRFANTACRHVMISRLPIPPEAPVARLVVPPRRATDSVAPRFDDRAP